MYWKSIKDYKPEEGSVVIIWQENLSEPNCSRFQKAIYYKTHFRIYPIGSGDVYRSTSDFVALDLEGDTCQITHWMNAPKNPNECEKLPTSEQVYEKSKSYTDIECNLQTFFDEDEIEIQRMRYMDGYAKAITDFINPNFDIINK